MRKLLLIFIALFIFFIPKVSHAVSVPKIDILAPQNFICDQPFIVNYQIENLSPELEYKIKSWAQTEIGTSLSIQNWDQLSNSWHFAYKTSRYYINSDRLSGFLIVKITDCEQTTLNIQNSINYCQAENCSTYFSNSQTISQLGLENPLQKIINLPEKIITNPQNYYLEINNSAFSQPICFAENFCNQTDITLPESNMIEKINIFNDLNKLVFTSTFSDNQIYFEELTTNCSISQQTISGYEYTEIPITLPICPDEIKHVIINQAGNTFSDTLTLPPEGIITNYSQLKFFPHNYILNQPIKISSIKTNSYYLSEVSVQGDEWVEFYNPYDQILNICNWTLDDGPGGSTPIIFASDCKVEPKSYQQILLNKHILNDDGDNLILKDEFNNLIAEFAYTKNTSDQSFIYQNGIWQLTTTPTPGKENIFSNPIPSNLVVSTENSLLDSSIYSININEVPSYNNKIVKVTGKIVEPKGSTWYLEDNSGKIKIYLQSKYKIKHPRFSTGMTLTVVGLVNFYKTYWRLLPTRAEDLIIISFPPKTIKITPKKDTNQNKVILTTANLENSQSLTYNFPPIKPPPELVESENIQTNRLQYNLYIVIINCLILSAIWYEQIAKINYLKRK